VVGGGGAWFGGGFDAASATHQELALRLVHAFGTRCGSASDTSRSASVLAHPANAFSRRCLGVGAPPEAPPCSRPTGRSPRPRVGERAGVVRHRRGLLPMRVAPLLGMPLPDGAGTRRTISRARALTAAGSRRLGLDPTRGSSLGRCGPRRHRQPRSTLVPLPTVQLTSFSMRATGADCGVVRFPPVDE